VAVPGPGKTSFEPRRIEDVAGSDKPGHDDVESGVIFSAELKSDGTKSMICD
jgi:hypothetical protein